MHFSIPVSADIRRSGSTPQRQYVIAQAYHVSILRGCRLNYIREIYPSLLYRSHLRRKGLLPSWTYASLVGAEHAAKHMAPVMSEHYLDAYPDVTQL